MGAEVREEEEAETDALQTDLGAAIKCWVDITDHTMKITHCFRRERENVRIYTTPLPRGKK